MQMLLSEAGKKSLVFFFSNEARSSEHNCKVEIYIFLTEKIIYISQGKWLHNVKISGPTDTIRTRQLKNDTQIVKIIVELDLLYT